MNSRCRQAFPRRKEEGRHGAKANVSVVRGFLESPDRLRGLVAGGGGLAADGLAEALWAGEAFYIEARREEPVCAYAVGDIPRRKGWPE